MINFQFKVPIKIYLYIQTTSINKKNKKNGRTSHDFLKFLGN